MTASPRRRIESYSPCRRCLRNSPKLTSRPNPQEGNPTSQLANCPLTEETLDRIATVESRLSIAPPNPLIRQMMLLQIGLLVAVIVGLV